MELISATASDTLGHAPSSTARGAGRCNIARMKFLLEDLSSHLKG